MKTKALAIAALIAITFFTSCKEKLPQQTEIALTQISVQSPLEKKTATLYVTAASGLL